MIKSICLKVEGQVQGVFFRRSAKEEAAKLEIKGFVRNEPNGSVYIEAEGEEKSLQEFIHWCKKGPEAALVKKVVIENCTRKNYPDFSVEWSDKAFWLKK